MSFMTEARAEEATAAPSSSLFDSLSNAFTSLFPSAHADEGDVSVNGEREKERVGTPES
jgi:hypothetical protein